MELIVEPDTYTPSIDGQGNYIDVIPPSLGQIETWALLSVWKSGTQNVYHHK